MWSEQHWEGTLLSSDGGSSGPPVNTPSASSDDHLKGSQPRRISPDAEQHYVQDIQEIIDLEQRLHTTQRELAQRIQQWNLRRRVQNPELRLMFRSSPGEHNQTASRHSLSFDSPRPVQTVTVSNYFKRKRGAYDDQPCVERENIPRRNHRIMQSSSQETEGSDNTDGPAKSPSTTPSSTSSIAYLRQAPHIEAWRQREPTYMILQFMSNYNPVQIVPSLSATERYRINMLSSCSLFLKYRVAGTNSDLQPIDTSAKSQAIRALEKHAKAMNFWDEEKEAEARQAVDSCCRSVELLIQHQQPALLSCMAIIVSELHHWKKSEYANEILSFASQLADLRLSQKHPLTVFLWCMRSLDSETQQQLTELLLTRGITLLQETDPDGQRDLISNFEYQLKRIYEVQGRIDAAIDLMKRRTYHYEVQLGHYHYETLNCIYQVARAYFLGKKWYDARFNFEDVMNRVPHLPPDARNRVWLLVNGNARLAQVYKKLGDNSKARSKALECLREASGEADLANNWRLHFAQDGILETENDSDQ